MEEITISEHRAYVTEPTGSIALDIAQCDGFSIRTCHLFIVAERPTEHKEQKYYRNGIASNCGLHTDKLGDYSEYYSTADIATCDNGPEVPNYRSLPRWR